MRSVLIGRGETWRTYFTKAPFAADAEAIKDAFEFEGEIVLSIDFVSEYPTIQFDEGFRGEPFSSWIVKVDKAHGE